VHVCCESDAVLLTMLHHMPQLLSDALEWWGKGCCHAVLLLLQGAFYVLPDMSAFFGPGVEMDGSGPVRDCDALAMYLIKVGVCGRGGGKGAL
jgi:hypothetical protein